MCRLLLLSTSLLTLILRLGALSCTWDLSKTPEQTKQQNCGYRCPDPWTKADPHYCGEPHPCCCKPTCTRDSNEAFLGVNWSDSYSRSQLPSTYQFAILKSHGIRNIKTFSYSGLASIAQVYGKERGSVSVHLGIPNVNLPDLALSPDKAMAFVQDNIMPYENIIKTVIVGNEPMICIKTKDWAKNRECGPLEIPSKVLPAMRNIRKALRAKGLHDIKVSSALNGGILDMATNPWTPCVGKFQDAVLPFLKEMYEFLMEDNSPLIVNIYPWFAMTENAITAGMGTGFGTKWVSDGSFKYYFNYDVQYEMLIVAICKAGMEKLDIWIGETGWPSAGNFAATLRNSHSYITNILRRQKGHNITSESEDLIRFDKFPKTIFLFEAFDESRKSLIESGNLYENHFGLFLEDGSPKWSDIHGMLALNLTDKKTSVDFGGLDDYQNKRCWRF